MSKCGLSDSQMKLIFQNVHGSLKLLDLHTNEMKDKASEAVDAMLSSCVNSLLTLNLSNCGISDVDGERQHSNLRGDVQ